MTQKEIIKARLLKHGYVTRNWALRNFITRLGARICDLNKEGLGVVGAFTEDNDYIYYLKEK